jgi:DNA-nicking Smr family endonuclease
LSNKISDKDKKDWEEFLIKDEKLPNKDSGLRERKKLKIRHLDLHGYTLEEANKTVEKFIEDSFEEGISKLIIVTGKGLHSDNEKNPYVSKNLSILKYSIPEFIENNSKLLKKITEIKDANIEDGGRGAFYIFLKKKL